MRKTRMQLTHKDWVGLLFKIMLDGYANMGEFQLTYNSRTPDDSSEAFLEPVVDIVGEHVSQVGASADEQEDQCQERLKIEESGL